MGQSIARSTEFYIIQNICSCVYVHTHFICRSENKGEAKSTNNVLELYLYIFYAFMNERIIRINMQYVTV